MDWFMKLMIFIHEAKEHLIYLCVDENPEVIPTDSSCIQI